MLHEPIFQDEQGKVGTVSMPWLLSFTYEKTFCKIPSQRGQFFGNLLQAPLMRDHHPYRHKDRFSCCRNIRLTSGGFERKSYFLCNTIFLHRGNRCYFKDLFRPFGQVIKHLIGKIIKGIV